jgi:hypothetical protein
VLETKVKAFAVGRGCSIVLAYLGECFMPERLVDVEKQGSRVLHTFPVTVSAPPEEEGAFKRKALEAAANAKLVPNEELDSLNPRCMSAAAANLLHTGIRMASWRRPKRV